MARGRESPLVANPHSSVKSSIQVSVFMHYLETLYLRVTFQQCGICIRILDYRCEMKQQLKISEFCEVNVCLVDEQKDITYCHLIISEVFI